MTTDRSRSAPVAVITGGAKRIGAAIATQLHQSGYRLVVHYRGSAHEAQTLVDGFNDVRPDSAVAVQGDLTISAQIASLASQSLAYFGRIDVIVNNASAFYPTPLSDVSDDDIQALVGTNFTAPLRLSQYAQDALTTSGGCIINISDAMARGARSRFSPYLASKAALESLTRSLALELAPNVRVNGVAPGAILWPDNEPSEDDKRHMLESIPLNRLGEPDDIAQAVQFLLDADYITGQVIAIDGGKTLA